MSASEPIPDDWADTIESDLKSSETGPDLGAPPRITELPVLAGVAANSFDNVLCETVIMHLDRALIVPAVRRMFEIVKPGGVFYLSWRVTDAADLRDGHGRLYAAFDASIVRDELKAATRLLDEEVVSASSGKKIHRLVVRKK